MTELEATLLVGKALHLGLITELEAEELAHLAASRLVKQLNHKPVDPNLIKREQELFHRVMQANEGTCGQKPKHTV